MPREVKQRHRHLAKADRIKRLAERQSDPNHVPAQSWEGPEHVVGKGGWVKSGS